MTAHKVNFSFNVLKVEQPVLEVSDGFEERLIQSLRECTSIEIELITAKKETFEADGHTMIRYSFTDLTDDKQDEFMDWAKRLSMFFYEAINHTNN